MENTIVKIKAASAAANAKFAKGLVKITSAGTRLWSVDDSDAIWIEGVITNKKENGGKAKGYFLQPANKADIETYGFLVSTLLNSDYTKVQSAGATGVSTVMLCLGKQLPIELTEEQVLKAYGPDARKPNERAVSDWKFVMAEKAKDPDAYRVTVLSYQELEGEGE
jgi:hypothetical protein